MTHKSCPWEQVDANDQTPRSKATFRAFWLHTQDATFPNSAAFQRNLTKNVSEITRTYVHTYPQCQLTLFTRELLKDV